MALIQKDLIGPDHVTKEPKRSQRIRINELAATLYETATELSKLSHCKGVQWETAKYLCNEASKAIIKFQNDLDKIV